MKYNITFLLHRFNLPKLEKVGAVIRSLSLTEKLIFWIFTLVFAFSTLIMLDQINKAFLVEVPTQGGHLTEGVVGSPRFINPLLATSNADRDLTTLIYSGLLRATPEGTLIPDLAKDYIISEDGLTYTFNLKDDIYFHDGTPITTDDVEFTVKLTMDNIIKSSKRANWEGVVIEKVDAKQIKFILKTPYSPFPGNTNLGILPKHIWGIIEPEQFAFSNLNIEPIGSGPYKINHTKRNSSGIMESYELVPFKRNSLGEAYISKLTINFYPNEESLINAYNKGSIEGVNTISPENAQTLSDAGKRIETVPLPRIFGLFFNQNQNSIFTYLEVRKALNKSLDKERIVSEILGGYGTTINSPIPTASKYFNSDSEKDLDVEGAIALLEKNGWKLNEETGVRAQSIKKVMVPLEFTITTSDAPELKAVANILKKEWEKIGFKVNIKIFEIGDLNQNVIRPREYEALLFGEIIGRDLDLFAFWHSSQRNDPGLNIALYANIKTDKLLEQTRTINDEGERLKKYSEFQEEIMKDVPTVFIYSPDFIYVVPEKIKGLSLEQVTLPSERFLDVQNWFIETEKIWKIFKK